MGEETKKKQSSRTSHLSVWGSPRHGYGPAAHYSLARHGWPLSLFASPAGQLFCRFGKGGLDAGVRTPAEALRGRSLRREGQGSELSSHFWSGEVTARDAHANRGGLAGPRLRPRLWNFASGRQAEPSNRDTTPAQCRASQAGSLPAPCAPRACAAACCFRGNRACREGTASAGAGGGMRPWQPQPCRTGGAEPTSCKTRPASVLRGWPHARAQARLPGGPSPRHLDYRASALTVFSTRCPVSWTLGRSLCDAVLSQCPSALGQ